MPETHSTGEFSGGADYQHTDTAGLAERAFPAPVRTAFRVYFEEDAYRAMMDHARTTSDVELGGVLVGDPFYDAVGPYLWIVGALRAEGARNRDTQITFTHESWVHINRIRDEKYPEHTLVGWYHTHPGFGIFLSEMDSFIQESFFDQPFQVAVVIDTKAKEEGCFVWDHGKPTPVNRYWAGSREIELVGGEARAFQRDTSGTHAEEGPSATCDRPGVGLLGTIPRLILALLIVLAGYTAWTTHTALRAQQEALSALREAVEKVHAEAAADRAAIGEALSAIKGALKEGNAEAVGQHRSIEEDHRTE